MSAEEERKRAYDEWLINGRLVGEQSAFMDGCRYEARRCAEIASGVSKRWDKMSDKGIADLIEGLILQRNEEEKS